MAAAEIKDLEMGDGMQCMNHPYTKNPGGICAFCLQEKLGKLVSSSFPLPKQVPSSSSSSPSLRSDSVGSNNASAASLSLSLSMAKSAISNANEGYFYNKNHGRASRLPFLLAKKKKKKIMGAAAASSSAADRTAGIVFKRSKSTTTPRTTAFTEDFSPRKRGGFWSFLHISSSSKHQTNATRKTDRIQERMPQNEIGSSKDDKFRARTGQNEDESSKDDARTSQNGSSSSKDEKFGAGTSQIEDGSSSSSSSSSSTATATTTTTATRVASFPKKATGSVKGFNVIVEEDGSPNVVVTEAGNRSSSSFDRKVSRSRSVGCGSRSFSGDFFERISNGFGDCTLRRVESQREGRNKLSNHNVGSSSGLRDMVRCGGIFSGFMIMTSSSSSSSSSATWVSSSSSTDHHHHLNGIKQGSLAQGSKNRSWGWAFASPMRAFSSTNTASNKYIASSASKEGNPIRTITESSNKNTAPKLDAIPSLLAIRS